MQGWTIQKEAKIKVSLKKKGGGLYLYDRSTLFTELTLEYFILLIDLPFKNGGIDPLSLLVDLTESRRHN